MSIHIDKKLKRQIKQAFDAPIPTRKLDFITANSKTLKTNKSKLYFLVSQAGYIRKRFWILSLLLVAVALLLSSIMNSNTQAVLENIVYILPPSNVFFLISSLLPLLTLLGVTEISKSSSYNMAELEASCKHNLAEIVLARLAIITSIHFILIMIIFVTIINDIQFSIVQAALYMIVPSMLNTYISLIVSNKMRSHGALYICGVTTGLICLTYVSAWSYQILFTSQYLYAWIIAFIALTALIILESNKLIKNIQFYTQ